jgi:dTDP-4-dehydrorhamnose reductase
MLAEINVSGVLNVGASTPISKANFGRMIAEVFGLDASLIQDVSLDSAKNLVARRAKNTGLNVKLTEALIGRLPTVREGVERLYAETFDGSAEQLRGRRTYP